jgi:hypothetical protein
MAAAVDVPRPVVASTHGSIGSTDAMGITSVTRKGKVTIPKALRQERVGDHI